MLLPSCQESTDKSAVTTFVLQMTACPFMSQTACRFPLSSLNLSVLVQHVQQLQLTTSIHGPGFCKIQRRLPPTSCSCSKHAFVARQKTERQDKIARQKGSDATHKDVSPIVRLRCRLQVCFSKAADTLFEPCRHLGLCRDCANEMETCPFCRKHIRRQVSVFRL